MDKKTYLVQGGRNPKKHAGMVNTPIYQTSTILFPTLDDYYAAGNGTPCYEDTKNASTLDFAYGISGTPTTFALQDALKTLEGGDTCVIVPSGLAAITLSLMAVLKAGDHVLMVDNVYGPSRRFCLEELSKYNITTDFYDPHVGADITSLIKPNTRVIFMESPGSLTFELTDIEAITTVAKQHNIVTMFDNSWASPLYCNPIKFGVDIVIQALTKFIGGHSDVLLGAIISKGDAIRKQILTTYRHHGTATSPQECWLALRGLRTMAARMEMQERHTHQLLKSIAQHPALESIIFPAAENHPDYTLWKKYFTGAASLFSVVLKKKYTRKQISAILAERSTIFGVGASWGGYESLIMHFDPPSIRTITHWPHEGSCLRFYIGLEDYPAVEREVINILDGFK